MTFIAKQISQIYSIQRPSQAVAAVVDFIADNPAIGTPYDIFEKLCLMTAKKANVDDPKRSAILRAYRKLPKECRA